MNEDTFLKESIAQRIIDSIPSIVFIVDENVRLIYWNRAGASILRDTFEELFQQKTGDVLGCINALESDGGCGTSSGCKDCLLRNAVREVYVGNKVLREQTSLLKKIGETITSIPVLITASPIELGGKKYALIFMEDIGELVQLRGMLPICAECGKVRTDPRYWESVESYFKKNYDIDFTNSICPACIEKRYPGFNEMYK